MLTHLSHAKIKTKREREEDKQTRRAMTTSGVGYRLRYTLPLQNTHTHTPSLSHTEQTNTFKPAINCNTFMILLLTPVRLLQVSTSMNKEDSVSNVGGREGQDDYYSSGAVSDMHFFKKNSIF